MSASVGSTSPGGRVRASFLASVGDIVFGVAASSADSQAVVLIGLLVGG